MVSAAELAALRRATELAARGVTTALPNPVVGCVLLDPSGAVVGEGFHEHAGGPHAEVVALAAAGDAARGATAVVTLEPCHHTGRTGPCSVALIEAGVTRVVVAVRDPWPTAAGGMQDLQAAGVDVVDLSQSGRAEVAAAEDVNRVWLGAMRQGRPFITVKIAMSVDGRVAAPDGSSQWITSVAAREHAHELRASSDVILAGIGTVLADDPSLTARRPDGTLRERQPLRVIVDSRGRTPAGARVRDGAAETFIATAEQFGLSVDGPGPATLGAGAAANEPRVDLRALVAEIGARGYRHIVVEGGPHVAASMIDLGLVDEVVVYLAPVLLGAGKAALEGGALQTLQQARRMRRVACESIGPDLALRFAIEHHS